MKTSEQTGGDKDKAKPWKESQKQKQSAPTEWGICQSSGKGKAFIGRKKPPKKQKNLVGACNLATANDTWMVTVRRWEECKCMCLCVSVCV